MRRSRLAGEPNASRRTPKVLRACNTIASFPATDEQHIGARDSRAKLHLGVNMQFNFPITQFLNHPITNRVIINPNPAATHVDKKFTALLVIHPRRSTSAPRKLSQIMPTNPQSAMMYT